MSSIEERLARDIAAVTGGVVVTGSDVREARAEVLGRAEEWRRRDRRRALVAVAAAAVVLPILGVVAYQSISDDEPAPAGPAPTSPPSTSPDVSDDFLQGSPPTPELLAGVWWVDDDNMQLRFTPEGEVALDETGQLFSNPGIAGTFDIVDDLVVITVDGGTLGCAGQTIAVRAAAPGPFTMRFLTDQPGTGNCASATGRWVLQQVLPTLPSMTDTGLAEEPGWGRAESRASFFGLWLAEQGGQVIELGRNGDYYVPGTAGEVLDHGEWTLNASRSRLSLVSAADSASCAEGDRLVLDGVEHPPPGDNAMRGAVEQNTCGGAWASPTWFQIPHAGD